MTNEVAGILSISICFGKEKMKKQKSRTLTTFFIYAIGLTLTIAFGIYAYSCYHISAQRIKNSLAHIEAYSHYELREGSKLLLSFDADTTRGAACFTDQWALLPSSCEGKAVAFLDTTIWNNKLKGVSPKQLLATRIDSLDSVCKDATWKVNELNYYIHSHNVTDMGYGSICEYTQKEITMRDSSRKLLDSLKHISKKTAKLKIYHKLSFAICHKNTRKTCNLVETLPQHSYDGARIFQLTTQQKPENAESVPMEKAVLFAKTMSAPIHKAIDLWLHPDTTGYYRGETDSLQHPQGHGAWFGYDGTYYEGHWEKGKREGFGFSIAPQKPLRVGEWKDNRFKGERLVYTSDRIYGIDISKYQHVIGKKKYAINWSQLRISHLGNISKKTVSGNVNYPIRFIYIKSTEGTTLLNPYYRKDYIAAKAHGFKVGTYHFFSPISPATTQAQQFLKKSYLRKGDLPPVLDVEPTNTQIKKMGGIQVLFSKVRTWLRLVERATGTKPILYISQTFVNKYLSLAPDLKNDYQIWIARYGEYKPDVHLVYWQLCPDGRINGIHGYVDINVFNGYKDAYTSFINTHSIR